MCPRVVLHHQGLGLVDSDVIDQCSEQQPVDGVQKPAGTVHVDSNGGVVDIFPAIACVTQDIICEDETKRPHPHPVLDASGHGLRVEAV